MKRSLSLLAVIALAVVAWAQLPATPGSFRFAVIGDSGTGGGGQIQVAARLFEWQTKLRFETVLMLGDNIYGSQQPRDFRAKFELPYARLLEAGVKFYAALGNHDSPAQQSYKPFHMDGRTYYTFRPHSGVRFFALDTNRLDRAQLAWLEKELADSESEWKIVYFHHPIYSSAARHGSNLELRALLEPLFQKYGVTVVLAGHDHVYERISPRKGVHYFVVGASAKLRVANVRESFLTAKAFDRDLSFLLMEIDKNGLHFQAVSRAGQIVDSGSISRPLSGTSVQP